MRAGEMRRLRITTTCLATALALFGAERAWPAAQTFDTALPVAKGEFIFREQFLARSLGQDRTPADPEVNVFGGASVLGYGIRGDLAFFGVAPLLRKELDVTIPDGTRVSRRTAGLGDARVFARYTAFQADVPGRTFRIAPFGV